MTKGRRTGAILAAIAVHGAVLAILALSTPLLRLPTARQTPDISLELSRSVRTDRASPRAIAAAPRSPPPAATRPRTPPPPPAFAPRTDLAPSPASLPPIPSLPAAPSPNTPTGGSASTPAVATGSGHDWRVRLDDGAPHAASRGLIGCGHASDRLTGAEQAECDRRLASLRGAEGPRVDAIPAEKRAYYDAVVQHRDEQRYKAFDDLHKMQLARGPGGAKSHGVDINVGYHCTFKFGAGAKEVNAAAGKKLGFPPCPIHLPGADPTPP